MNILELLEQRIVFFDGAMGTMLQKAGMPHGAVPEHLNITNPDMVRNIHCEYVRAGCDVIKTNTFGANSLKLPAEPYSVEEVVTAAVKNARAAGAPYVALDIGPTGKLLEPLGDTGFEEAYNAFAKAAAVGEKAGADLILIETMSDIYEAKAAVLAAKEQTSLPVFVTMTFDGNGNLLTGGDILTAVTVLEGLGADCIGMNCGLGPVQMEKLFLDFLKYSSVPVLLNPNAGLPVTENGETYYTVTPDEFAGYMESFAKRGARAIGGCCGTTPAHLAKTVQLAKNVSPVPVVPKNYTVVTSYNKNVIIDDGPVMVGERINPTGKSKFKQALREGNMDYILDEAMSQIDHGAHILDVNVGLPELDESAVMTNVVKKLQSVVNTPLQIDSSNPETLERALRLYNGKAMVNSVNGKQESMDAVLPLIKKYGGTVVALTMDENGIPDTAQGRYEIAERIVRRARDYGIAKKDIVVDTLVMTISSEQRQAAVTLDALQMVKERLGVKTILGVSNISFGLPERENVNSTFFALALGRGLDCGIINPMAPAMRQVFYSYRALNGRDFMCMDYIHTYAPTDDSAPASDALGYAVVKGQKEKAADLAVAMLNDNQPLDIINNSLMPALDKVGQDFESNKIFLPQLLASADAAKAAFAKIQEFIKTNGGAMEQKGKIILATVHGDVHDIGKNIVKVLLENYGYQVLDLGKDVPPELIVETARQQQVKLVGLSALMTTTVPSMANTIALLRQKGVDCKIVVGGAVMTDVCAKEIGADYYAKDAMATVVVAKEVLGA